MFQQILSVVGVAVGTNYVACVRSKDSDQFFTKDGEMPESPLILDPSAAALTCVVASGSLVLMFYLFEYLSYVLIFSTMISSFIALMYLLYPVTNNVVDFCGLGDTKIKLGSLTLQRFFLGSFSVTILVAWLLTGHWLLNDFLGFAICVLGVSLVKIKNIKVACILLVCLFFYDIFWVFYSKQFFGENVMLSVAQKTATNPAVKVAKIMNMDGSSLASHLELPAKMLIPGFDGSMSMLGLGDIAIPGLLLSFLLRVPIPRSKTYFWTGMVGYAIGLTLTMMASIVYHHAQPALLFLVPSILIPIFCLSLYWKDFRTLWDATEGPETVEGKHV